MYAEMVLFVCHFRLQKCEALVCMLFRRRVCVVVIGFRDDLVVTS
jgi:hypothetical protein